MITTDYKTARSQIQDGDIIFVANKKTIVARVIQFFTQSHYSHVCIAFWVTIAGVDRLMVVEAQGGTKRRVLNASFYDRFDLDVVKAPKDWNSYANEALSKIGEAKYGYFEAAYVGLREFLLKKFNIKLPRKNIDSDEEICSEFVASLLGLAEVNVSPQALWVELGSKVDLRIIV